MKIEIKGPIISDADQWIYDWFGIPATSPSKVNALIDKAIRNNDNELLVIINSGGGSVFHASEIYTSLKSFSGKVKTRIVGVAASAASVIASAGYCEMTPTGQLMIHNATNGKYGDYRDMDENSVFLQKVNRSIMNAYTSKTGKSIEELKSLMDAETWMTAQEAKEHGFIDAIMFEEEQNAVANANPLHLVNGILPPEVIEKVRNELLKDKSLGVLNSVSNINYDETKNKKEDEKMDLEKLQNEHPELFKQVKNMGFEEGVKAENERIKAIEDMAPVGHEKMVYDAKFTTPVTAEKLAVQVIKAQKELSQNYLNNVKEDAQILNEVKPSHAPENDNVSDEEKAAQALINMWGGQQ